MKIKKSNIKMENSQYLHRNKLFWINKRIFDIVLSLFLLPLLFTIGIILLWLSAAITLFTGYEYMRKGIDHAISEDNKD